MREANFTSYKYIKGLMIDGQYDFIIANYSKIPNSVKTKYFKKNKQYLSDELFKIKSDEWDAKLAELRKHLPNLDLDHLISILDGDYEALKIFTRSDITVLKNKYIRFIKQWAREATKDALSTVFVLPNIVFDECNAQNIEDENRAIFVILDRLYSVDPNLCIRAIQANSNRIFPLTGSFAKERGNAVINYFAKKGHNTIALSFGLHQSIKDAYNFDVKVKHPTPIEEVDNYLSQKVKFSQLSDEVFINDESFNLLLKGVKVLAQQKILGDTNDQQLLIENCEKIYNLTEEIRRACIERRKRLGIKTTKNSSNKDYIESVLLSELLN